MFSMRKALGLSGVVALMAVTAAPALAAKSPPPVLQNALSGGKSKVQRSIVSQTFPNPTGTQSFGSVQCPVGSVSSGGGVFGFSGFGGPGPGMQQTVNSTYPFGNGWAAFMNNATAVNSSFTVYAVCLRVK